MQWITRERAEVDRVACPWLISRFIDPSPEFMYVPANQVLAEAERRGADTAAKDLTPESRGLDAIAGGFQMMEISDHEKLKWEFPLYAALYVYCGGRWPIPRPTEGV